MSAQLAPRLDRPAPPSLARLSEQATCLAGMLAAVQFIHPERREHMLIECQNFSDDIGIALSAHVRAEVSNG